MEVHAGRHAVERKAVLSQSRTQGVALREGGVSDCERTAVEPRPLYEGAGPAIANVLWIVGSRFGWGRRART